MKDVTKATLAKLQRVNRSTVTRWCLGPLEAAMVGDRIDLEHEAAKEFFKQRRAEQQAKDAVYRAPGSGVADVLRDSCDATDGSDTGSGDGSTGEYTDIYSMTFEEARRRHGSGPEFQDLLKLHNLYEDGRKKRIANDEKEGRLIGREVVRAAIIGLVDSSNRRLLSDVPETGVRLLYGHCNAGDPIETARTTLKDLLSSHLTPAKDQVVQSLLDAASDESEPADEDLPGPMVDTGAA